MIDYSKKQLKSLAKKRGINVSTLKTLIKLIKLNEEMLISLKRNYNLNDHDDEFKTWVFDCCYQAYKIGVQLYNKNLEQFVNGNLSQWEKEEIQIQINEYQEGYFIFISSLLVEVLNISQKRQTPPNAI